MTGQLELADGRDLGYSEWGPVGAPVIFYCHGFPGCHAEVNWFLPTIESQGLDTRIVALDRPGFGTSTFAPHRTLMDWPGDLAEAADILGIEQFAVLGVSGGGPFALACATQLQDRLTRVGVVATLAPAEAPGMEHASIAQTPTNGLARRLQFALLSGLFRLGQEDRFVSRAKDTMSEADQVALEQPETRRVFVESMSGAFAQGGRASAHETELLRGPWGFEPESVTAETHLWHGGADEMAPPSAGRWLADRIPDSNFVLWPEHGHITWGSAPEAADVFDTMLGPSLGS